jgi:hypothetical protein
MSQPQYSQLICTPRCSLSKVIASRWKQLPASGKQFYREVARVDQEQYELYLAASKQPLGRPV